MTTPEQRRNAVEHVVALLRAIATEAADRIAELEQTVTDLGTCGRSYLARIAELEVREHAAVEKARTEERERCAKVRALPPKETTSPLTDAERRELDNLRAARNALASGGGPLCDEDADRLNELDATREGDAVSGTTESVEGACGVEDKDCADHGPPKEAAPPAEQERATPAPQRGTATGALFEEDEAYRLASVYFAEFDSSHTRLVQRLRAYGDARVREATASDAEAIQAYGADKRQSGYEAGIREALAACAAAVDALPTSSPKRDGASLCVKRVSKLLPVAASGAARVPGVDAGPPVGECTCGNPYPDDEHDEHCPLFGSAAGKP